MEYSSKFRKKAVNAAENAWTLNQGFEPTFHKYVLWNCFLHCCILRCYAVINLVWNTNLIFISIFATLWIPFTENDCAAPNLSTLNRKLSQNLNNSSNLVIFVGFFKEPSMDFNKTSQNWLLWLQILISFLLEENCNQ